MSTLFTLSQSWFDLPSLYEQIAYTVEGDAILLIQDAVLALQSPIALASFIAKADSNNVKVFALQEDILLRGIENKYQPVELVDYDGFVSLVTSHTKQVAW